MQLSAIVVFVAITTVAYGKLVSDPIACLNGGVFKQGKCVCSRRFEGTTCEIEPCLNGGVKAHNGKCHCPFGLAGDRCEQVTHCSNHGALANGTCKCEPRWGGIFCNERTCHNGFSVGAENAFCVCDNGFTGPFCDMKLNCGHGSVNDNNQCECEVNWTGAECGQCAENFDQVGNECIEKKPENAQPILHSKKVALTPIIIIGGFCTVLIVAVGVALFYVMKKRTKRSPSNSERASATDV